MEDQAEGVGVRKLKTEPTQRQEDQNQLALKKEEKREEVYKQEVQR